MTYTAELYVDGVIRWRESDIEHRPEEQDITIMEKPLKTELGWQFRGSQIVYLVDSDRRISRDSIAKLVITEEQERAIDNVNHPKHYTKHPSGIECIQVTEHMGFNLGNAMKYIWRCDLKLDAIEDLKKAEFYIKREIDKREKASG